MALLDYMQWTDEQWEAYRKATVTISLEDLDRFITAMELLRDGSRLTSEARQAWSTYIPPMFRLLMEECGKINQIVRESADAEPDDPPAILDSWPARDELGRPINA